MRPKRFEIAADLTQSVPLPPEKGLSFKQWKFLGNGPEVDMVCLNEHVYGRIIHYWSSRTYPCLRPEAKCEICDAGGAHMVRWEGYLSVKVRDQKGVYWIRISPGLARSLPALAEHSTNLRGARLRVRRVGANDRGQLQGVLTLGYWPSAKLPEGIDLPRFMRQQWESGSKVEDLAEGEIPTGIPY